MTETQAPYQAGEAQAAEPEKTLGQMAAEKWFEDYSEWFKWSSLEDLHRQQWEDNAATVQAEVLRRMAVHLRATWAQMPHEQDQREDWAGVGWELAVTALEAYARRTAERGPA